MATKSIGTLAAKLTVDTKGWIGGFKQADKEALTFTKRIERQLKSFRQTFSKAAVVGTGLFAGKRAVDAFVNSLARVEKQSGLLDANKDAAQAAASLERMGLAISKVDAASMAGLVQKLREAEAIIIGIGDNIVNFLTPAVDGFVTQWIIGIESLIKEKEKLETSRTGGFLRGIGDAIGAGAIAGMAKVLGVTADELKKGLNEQARDADKFRSNSRAAVPDVAKPPEAAKVRQLQGTQSPFERGTTAAAVAVMEMKGSPIHAVEKNTAEMLTVLKAIRDQKPQPQVGRARINK